MKTRITSKQTPMAGEGLWESSEMAVRIRMMSAGNCLLPRKQSLTAQGAWGEPVEIEFIDRQPYGFVFTGGQEASFRVPSGHRFVIEQVNVTSWGDDGALSMRLVSISPLIYRSIEVMCLSELSAEDASSGVATAPIVLNGSSANSFQFSDRTVHDSPTVPADNYLQIWGYLEPSYFLNELLYAEEDASPRSYVQADFNSVAR